MDETTLRLSAMAWTRTVTCRECGGHFWDKVSKTANAEDWKWTCRCGHVMTTTEAAMNH